MQNERQCRGASTSLNKYRSHRTRLHKELDAASMALGATSCAETRKEYEKKIEAIRTSLSSIEASIARFEDIIEECRMREEETRQSSEEVASRDQPD